MRFCLHANQFIFDHVNGAPGLTLIERLTTIFVRRLWKTKHAQKSFQNFSQSCVLSTDRIEIHQSQSVVWPSDILYVMLEGCDWWISIRSVDNRYDWRKLWKRFCGCFVFESCVSTKTMVKQVRNGLLSNLFFHFSPTFAFSKLLSPEYQNVLCLWKVLIILLCIKFSHAFWAQPDTILSLLKF